MLLPPSHRSARLRWVVLFGVWFVYATFGLVASSLAPLVTSIELDLGLSHAAMGSVMGAWQILYIASAIPAGVLLDRLGSRWALSLGTLFIAASALGRSLADGYWSLLVAVMLFGLGGPVISAGAPKVVTLLFSGSKRGLAMGIYATGPAVGSIISLTMTQSVILPFFEGDWRSVMQIWSVLVVIAGALWLVIASIARLEGGAGEVRSGEEMPYLRRLRWLITTPAVRILLAISVGSFLFHHGLNNWLPEILHAGGMSLVRAGYWAAIPTAVGICGALLIPRLAVPKRRFALLLMMCGMAAGASILLRWGSGPVLLSGLFMQGIVRSSLTIILLLTLMELPGIGERHAGTASGLFFAAAEVGGFLGPLSIGVLYAATGGFGAGLALLTVVSLAMGVGVVWLRLQVRRLS